jgi:hypothetical protein
MNRVILLFLAIASISCTSNTSQIGSDFFGDGMLDVSYIDTSTVKLSTIRYEQIMTNSKDRVVVGSHVDEQLGRVTAIPFLQLGLNVALTLQDMNTEYAFLALVLDHDEYSYYDTGSVMTLNVHRVIEDIEWSEGLDIKNTDRFLYESTPLGSTSLKARPHRDDTLAVFLDDTFGQLIYQMAVDGSSDLESNDDFVDFLKGLAILPDTTSSGPLVGFSGDSELRLYYIDKSSVPSHLEYLAFPMNSGFCYTHYKLNGDSQFSDIDPEEYIESSGTNDLAFIQGGTGLALRVDIPYLRELKNVQNFYVSRALLDLVVADDSYEDTTPLAETLTAYQANKRNLIYSETIYSADIYKDNLEREVKYTVDITSFVNEQMALAEFNNNAIILNIGGDNYTAGVDRVYFAEKSLEYKTRLRIYYATINQ